MKKNNKIGLTSFLKLDIVLIIIFLAIPMVNYLNYILRGANTTFLVFLLWLILVLLKKKSLGIFMNGLKRRKVALFSIILFILISFFNYIFVKTTSKALNYSIHSIYFILILVIDTYYTYRNKNLKFIILAGVILALGVQAIISIPYILSNNFLLIRELSSGQLSQSQEIEAFRNGLGNNGLYSSLGAVSLLGLSSLNRFSVLLKTLLIICILSLIATIFLSTFFASIMLFLFGCIIFMFRHFKLKLKFKPILLISFLSIAIFYTYDNFISDTRLLDPIYKKIELFSEGGTTSRDRLAMVSWNTFSQNPFFGVGVPENGSYDIVGEHAPWIDFFAYFGFLGFLPLLLFYYNLISKNFKSLFRNISLISTARLSGIVIFVISNFISPMFVVFTMYSFFILFYTAPLGSEISKGFYKTRDQL